MERIDICPRMKIGSCAPCGEMAGLVDAVVIGLRQVGPALAELKSDVCPVGETPVVPDLCVKRQSSVRFRLRGR